MAIKVLCKHCKTGFKAKDELAGRRVKCPKCKTPITIGQAVAPASPKKKKTPVAVATHNPLLDLLDEQDVRSVARGPICENCAAEVQPGAVICIECGFNLKTGEQLETEAYDDSEAIASDATMSDAERIMAKAEKAIEDVPISSDDQDFGDGSESYLIATVCAVIGFVAIAGGMIIIFSMEQIGEVVTSSFISTLAAVGLYGAMGFWITTVAFKMGKGHGIGCVFSGGLWCIVFGFLQGRQLIVPTIILLGSLLIGIASGVYTYQNGMFP